MGGSGKRPGQSRAYRLGVSLALLVSLLVVWITIVRDDNTGAGFFMVVMAAAVGAAAASLRPAGMARAMVGVAIMQAALGTLIATAPSTIAVPGASLKILIFSGVFVAIWLFAAAAFRSSAKDIHLE